MVLSGISVFIAIRSILAESQPLGCGAISAIFLGVGSHVYFVTHSQNLPLKTSGCIVIIKDKKDLSFQRNQKHISQILTTSIRGDFCHISRGWKQFIFCHHSQNLPLKTSDCIVVIKDKWDLYFQRD